jgi:hypothetical protein
VTRPPPHRSRRAVFSHRALQEYSPPPSGRSLGSCHSGLRSPNDPWSLDAQAREQLFVARPGVTAPLATPVEPCLQDPHGAGEELFEAGEVAVYPVVVVGPPALGMHPRKQPSPTQLSVLLTPWGEARQGVPLRLPRGPASEMVFPRSILPPATREPQKLEAGLLGRAWPTARDDPRLLRRPLPSACPEPLAQRLVEAVRLCLMRKRTHTIVRVSDQARLSSTSPRDPFLEPPIQCIVPVHMRKDR